MGERERKRWGQGEWAVQGEGRSKRGGGRSSRGEKDLSWPLSTPGHPDHPRPPRPPQATPPWASANIIQPTPDKVKVKACYHHPETLTYRLIQNLRLRRCSPSSPLLPVVAVAPRRRRRSPSSPSIPLVAVDPPRRRRSLSSPSIPVAVNRRRHRRSPSIRVDP